MAHHLIIRPFKTRKRVVQYGFQAVLEKKSNPKSFNLKHSNTSVNSSFWSGAECVSKFISRCAVSVNITSSPRGPTPRPSEKLQKAAFKVRAGNFCSAPDPAIEPLYGGPALYLKAFRRFNWLWRQGLPHHAWLQLLQYEGGYTGRAHSDAINTKVQWARDVY